MDLWEEQSVGLIWWKWCAAYPNNEILSPSADKGRMQRVDSSAAPAEGHLLWY